VKEAAMEELWQLEERFWRDGVEVYEEFLAPEALMVFPGIGIMDRAAIIDSLRHAPRWTQLAITEPHALCTENTAVLAYRAEARRGDEAPYRAHCSSTYVPGPQGWLMLAHQQTPVVT
jgi:hypothetical protein